MKINIKSNRTITDIREEFNGYYPFLKLEFFKKPHEESESSLRKEMIPGTFTLGEIMKIKKEGVVNLKNSMTVAELEQELRDIYGLFGQVFRKSGRVWLETTVTDNLTLQTQNDLGKEKSTPAQQPDITDIDYD